MENASKALIIAGAILISIVLVALGVLVVNNLNGTIEQTTTQMSSHEIEQFNETFTTYIGTKVSAGNVKTLLGKIRTNQASYDVGDNRRFGLIASNASGSTLFIDKTIAARTATKTEYNTGITSILGKVLSGRTYTVSATYLDSGLIDSISITMNI